jgi:hypothetical protein
MELINFSRQSILERVGDEKFLVKIYNADYKVYAPLPDGFGFTVGSEYSSPFDVSSLSGGLQKAYAIAGFAQKIGMYMRKLYTNPEPTELSIEMEFTAENDTWNDVLYPVIALKLMALGSILDLRDINEKTRNAFTTLSNGLKSVAETFGLENPEIDDGYVVQFDENSSLGEKADGILKTIGFISAPKFVNVKFGNVMTWEKCYITSVATSFSNVLDSRGYPLSAKCTVTITPEKYPVADDILEMYGPKNTRGLR